MGSKRNKKTTKTITIQRPDDKPAFKNEGLGMEGISGGGKPEATGFTIFLDRLNQAVLPLVRKGDTVYLGTSESPISVKRLEGGTIGYVSSRDEEKVRSAAISAGRIQEVKSEGTGKKCLVRIN